MPDFYVKNDAGVWIRSDSQYVKIPVLGWVRAMEVYEKTGASTWTKRMDNDITPPGPPLISTSFSEATSELTVNVTMPSDNDVSWGNVKILDTGWPSNPGARTYVTGWNTTMQTDGRQFSDLIGGPGTKFTRRVKVARGKTAYVRAWAMDDSGNWSTPASASRSIPYPPAPAPKLVTKTAYINVTASGSWNRSSRYWRNDSNAKAVYQGGDGHWDGRWFYGSAIKAALAKAHQIQEIKVYIQRVNSQHGVSAGAQVRIGAHGQASRPSGAPNALVSVQNGPQLKRGEGQWWTMPASWYPGFKSGSNMGVGLYAGTTSYTHPNYLYAHGHGTSSGRIYLKWTEYA